MADVEMASVGIPARPTLAVDVPADMPLDTLLATLNKDGAGLDSDERLRAPDADLILQLYRSILSLAPLVDAQAALEKDKEERERRTVDAESQLHEAERLKAEAEARAEDDRLAKEAALGEKMELSGKLAQVEGTLAALQSTSESGVAQSAEVAGRLEKAEQEKRDMLDMLEREKTECARRAEEIDNLTARAREARAEVNRLSTELQDARSAEGNAKVGHTSEREKQAALTDSNLPCSSRSRVWSRSSASRARMPHGPTTSLAGQRKSTQPIEAGPTTKSSRFPTRSSLRTRLWNQPKPRHNRCNQPTKRRWPASRRPTERNQSCDRSSSRTRLHSRQK